MSIEYDAVSTGSGGTGTSRTVSHTCSGDNRILFVSVDTYKGGGSGGYITGVTYNGVAMTLIENRPILSECDDTLYYLIAPASGTHDIVASYNTTVSSTVRGISYTGAKQSGVPDAHTGTGPTAGQISITTTVTTIADNCWLVGAYNSFSNAFANGTGTIIRAGTTIAMADSNGARSIGSQSLNLTLTSDTVSGIMASFAPAPAVAPTVTTQAVSSIAQTTATGNGNVTADGGATITERGTVYSTSANPTTADTKDTSAGTTGAFTTSIDGLLRNTLYHVRAYAINSVGTSYGDDVTFTTLTGVQVNIGDVWKEVSNVQINIGDVWKTVTHAQINIGDAWKTIF